MTQRYPIQRSSLFRSAPNRADNSAPFHSICDLQYCCHSNILRHHREITILKLTIKTDTLKFFTLGWDALCTLHSFFRYFVFMTLRCDVHQGVWLRGKMHTAESNSAVWCTPWSFLTIRISWRNQNRIRKYFTLFIRGPDGIESWTK